MGYGVGLTRHRLHLHEAAPARFFQPTLAAAGQVQIGSPRRHGFVDLVHLPLAQQRVVSRAGGRLHGEDQHTGGFAVQPVHRGQRGDAQQPGQPHQCGLLQVASGGRDWQEVRFVDHHQVLVLVQQRQLKGHPGLGRRGAPVPHHFAG